MKSKRIFTVLLVFIMTFSLCLPSSAAEMIKGMNSDDITGFVINNETNAEVEMEKLTEVEIQSLMNAGCAGEQDNEESVSENDITKNVDCKLEDVSGGNGGEDNIKLVTDTVPVYNAGDSISDATNIYPGYTYYGSITADDTNIEDWYKVTVNSSGLIQFDLNAYIGRLDYYLYDSQGTELGYVHAMANSITGMSNVTYATYVNQGVYYFVVTKARLYGWWDDCNYGDYFFSLSYVDAKESFAEPTYGNNNELRVADAISLGQEYRGLISCGDGQDFYKFYLNSSSRINLDFKSNMKCLNFYLYDEDGNELMYYQPWWNETTQTITWSTDIDLKSGTYYIAVNNSYLGTYSFKLANTSANESFQESKNVTNNLLTTANSISTGITYQGQLALNDSIDFYKINIDSASNIIFTSKAYMQAVNYKIYDSSGKEIWSDTSWWNDLTYESNMTKQIDLNAGNYYFVVERYSSSYTGSYLFNVAIHNHKYKTVITKATTTTDGMVEKKCSCGKVKSSKTVYAVNNIYLSKTTYTYDGKAKKPTVVVKNSQGKKVSSSNYTVTYSKGRKNVGKYTVTIKFKGNYKGTEKITFYIYPKKIGITQLISNKRGFTVRFKKTPKQASGYQVQYSTSNSFWWTTTKNIKSGNKSAAKITGLSSNRTYYVRVRAYKKVGGATYYSDWSNAKKVKTR